MNNITVERVHELFSYDPETVHTARVDNKTGLLGVSWKASRQKYVAQIQIDRKVKYLGLFENPNDAHEAYLEAKRLHHPGCTI